MLHWRHYLIGTSTPFTIFTDHKNLIYFTERQQLNRRQIRWAEILSDFSFILSYRQGKLNGPADGLSRRPDYFSSVDLPVEPLLPSFHLCSALHRAPISLSLKDLAEKLKVALSDDPLFLQKSVACLPPFKIFGGLLYHGECFYIPDKKDLRDFVYSVCHESPLAGHFQPWESISMDFITKLPVSSGFDSILVVVDRLTKLAHFIPHQEASNSLALTNVLFKEVFRHHGFPLTVISDRGPQFASQFITELYSLLSIKPRLSTAYHPETDGQTERVNAILEQYVRCFVTDTQTEWSRLLPFAEISYNNSLHSSTKFSPFFANYGFNPHLNIINDTGASAEANSCVANLLKVRVSLFENLKKAQENYKRFADAKRADSPGFQVGDLVMLSSKNLRLCLPSKKFTSKFVGPFKILQIVNPVCFRLELPSSWKIHPSFHASLLKKFIARRLALPDTPVTPPPPIEEQEFEVAAVLDSRLRQKEVEYLFDWRGFGPHERTWQPCENVDSIRPLLNAFHSQYPSKPRDPRL